MVFDTDKFLYKYFYETNYMFEMRRRLVNILMDNDFINDVNVANSRALIIINYKIYGMRYEPNVNDWVLRTLNKLAGRDFEEIIINQEPIKQSSLTSRPTPSLKINKSKSRSKNMKNIEIDDTKKFYNETAYESNREKSDIIGMRKYNNIIKTILLDTYSDKIKEKYTDLYGLDICCGNFGDMFKWKNIGAKYVFGADFAEDRLKEGMRRYMKQGLYDDYSLTLLHEDCIKNNINPKLKDLYFQLSSCQFALHYAFGNEEDATRLINNCTEKLLKDGYFVGTTIHSGRLLSLIQENGGKSWESKNGKLKIKFDEDVSDYNGDDIDYGLKYLFDLSGRVQAYEYLVGINQLKDIGDQLGLDLILYKSFDKFEKENKDYKFPKLSDEEREIVDLYCVFVFKKKNGMEEYPLINKVGGEFINE